MESAGVVGVHDLMHGENVRAYVEIKPGAPAEGRRTHPIRPRAWRLQGAPEEIVLLDAMPLNPTGKVDRAALKKVAAADHAHHR